MNKKFFFNKLLKFFFRHQPPSNAEEGAICFYSPEPCDGVHHYLKLIPCKKNGMFPEVGTITEEELFELDKKLMEKQNEKVKKMLSEMGLSTTDINNVPPNNDNNGGGRLLN